ncbi:hypothetical protein V8E36_000425 [Tilletia maclaganii]
MATSVSSCLSEVQVPAGPCRDISRGQEPIPIPLEAPEHTPWRALLGDRFEEYLAERYFHSSYIHAVAERVRRERSEQGSEGPDDADLEPSLYGCECQDPNACSSTSEMCDCVAEHGNFYVRAPDSVASHQPVLDIDAIPPAHVLYECSEVCACQEGQDTRWPERQSACCLSTVRSGVRLALVVKPVPFAVLDNAHAANGEERSPGLGVFAGRAIPRGTFICNYEGELISPSESHRRWSHQAAAGQGNYILSIREKVQGTGAEHRVDMDPTRKGNVARFINHLCPPLTNVVIVPVRCEGPFVLVQSGASTSSQSLDLIRLVDWHQRAAKESPSNLTSVRDDDVPAGGKAQQVIAVVSAPPKAAMFASRYIEAGEQLGFDYYDAGQDRPLQDVSQRTDAPRPTSAESKIPTSSSHEGPSDTSRSRRDPDSNPGPEHGGRDPDELSHQTLDKRTRCLCASPACRGWLPLDMEL